MSAVASHVGRVINRICVLTVAFLSWESSRRSAGALLSPSSPRLFVSLPKVSFISLSNNDFDNFNEEADRLQKKAQEFREQIRQLEAQMSEKRETSIRTTVKETLTNVESEKSLRDKRILIVGANGRLGSMVTRHLLRSHPEVKEVVAAVHYVGTATTRGYGRLSYEVGAEDGTGSIGAAWSSEERNASFQYNAQVMNTYNLNKLRVVEVELLNPTQVQTITRDCDAIIYCATDFEGNRPRAIASLNAAFLFRAVADPFKGRVEVEGVRNCLQGLLASLKDKRWKDQRDDRNSNAGNASSSRGPTQFILVSTAPDTFGTFETPFGEFNALKRQGEYIVSNDYPSITYCILQMGRFDENVPEGLDLIHAQAEEDTTVEQGVIGTSVVFGNGVKAGGKKQQKRINRRDAARAAVEALCDGNLERKKVQIYSMMIQ